MDEYYKVEIVKVADEDESYHPVKIAKMQIIPRKDDIVQLDIDDYTSGLYLVGRIHLKEITHEITATAFVTELKIYDRY